MIVFIESIKIFDENGLIKTISNNDLYYFSKDNKNEINLKKGKYRVIISVSKSCKLNFKRKFKDNRVKFIGYTNENNQGILKEKNIPYNEMDIKDNNYKYGEKIDRSVQIARLFESLYNEPISEILKK